MTDRGAESLPTTSLGHYHVRAKIGSGGMGDVFDAVHTGLNKRVAIKTLRKRFLDDDVVVARFLREGQLASRIRHPNIVDITDVGMMGGLPCLVMEHLEGESFSALIRRERCLPIDTIVDVLLPIVAAVDFAHEHGIVHRDLKPSNIFLSRSWNGEIVPKVLDFGISKLVHDSQQAALTTASAFVGTPHYASPELMRAEKLADGRSDEYSMGVILYEAATGVRPFADLGNNFVALAMAICKGEYTPLRQRNPNVPASFEEVVKRAMALHAQERFITMRALGEALLPFASERVRMIWAPTFNGQSGAASSGSQDLPQGTVSIPTVASVPPISSAGPASPAARPPSVPNAPASETPISQHSPHRGSSIPSGSIPHGPHGTFSHHPPIHPSEFARTPGGYPSATPPGAAFDRFPSYGAGTATSPPNIAPVRGSGAVTAVIGLSLGLAILVSVVMLRTARRDDPIRSAAAATAAEAFTVDLQVSPATALIEIDGATAGTGHASKAFPRDGRNHTLRLSAPGYESLLVEFKDTSPPPPAIGLRPLAPAGAAGESPSGAGQQAGAAAGQAQGGALGARRGAAASPIPTSTPAGKMKGNSEPRPKTDNIDPWE